MSADMSAETLREAARVAPDVVRSPEVGKALALLLANEANAMEAEYAPYNGARKALLSDVARAVLRETP